MIRKPAHKEVLHPPGQCEVKNDFDRYPYLSKTAVCIPKKLGDIIDSVKKHEEMLMNEKKKLTFEQWTNESGVWYHTSVKDGDWTIEQALKECWKAAQENK